MMKKNILFCLVVLLAFSMSGQDLEGAKDSNSSIQGNDKKPPQTLVEKKDSLVEMKMKEKPRKVIKATRNKIPPKMVPPKKNPLKKVNQKKNARRVNAPPIRVKEATKPPTIPVPKVYKLKVTLHDIQCISSSDSDNKDDYGIQQHIYYKADGKIKRPVSKNIRTFKDNCDDKIDNGNMYRNGGDNVFGDAIDDKDWKGANALLCGDSDHQIHVKKSSQRRSNVNNSMTFHITQAEYDDPNAEMIINTTVIEHNSTIDNHAMTFGSNNNKTYNYDGKKKPVAIQDVLDVLTGVRTLNATKAYFDGTIARGVKFDNFDGLALPLTKMENNRKIYLEGVLRARGSTAENKAAIWMRFELVD